MVMEMITNYFARQTPSQKGKINNHMAVRKILRLLRNRKFRYHVHKTVEARRSV
jgi:hypothetical protein